MFKDKNLAKHLLIPVNLIFSLLSTYLNKKIATHFHLTFFVLLIQSVIVVFLLILLRCLNVIHFKIERKHTILWIPATLCLILMIFSGLKALSTASISIFTLFKNNTLILIALAEKYMFNRPISFASGISFLLMIISSLFMSKKDTIGDLYWLILNVIVSGVYVLMLRWTFIKYKLEKSLIPIDIARLNEVLPTNTRLEHRKTNRDVCTASHMESTATDQRAYRKSEQYEASHAKKYDKNKTSHIRTPDILYLSASNEAKGYKSSNVPHINKAAENDQYNIADGNILIDKKPSCTPHGNKTAENEQYNITDDNIKLDTIEYNMSYDSEIDISRPLETGGSDSANLNSNHEHDIMINEDMIPKDKDPIKDTYHSGTKSIQLSGNKGVNIEDHVSQENPLHSVLVFSEKKESQPRTAISHLIRLFEQEKIPMDSSNATNEIYIRVQETRLIKRHIDYDFAALAYTQILSIPFLLILSICIDDFFEDLSFRKRFMLDVFKKPDFIDSFLLGITLNSKNRFLIVILQNVLLLKSFLINIQDLNISYLSGRLFIIIFLSSIAVFFVALSSIKILSKYSSTTLSMLGALNKVLLSLSGIRSDLYELTGIFLGCVASILYTETLRKE